MPSVIPAITAAVAMVEAWASQASVVLVRPTKARPTTGIIGAPHPITVQPPAGAPGRAAPVAPEREVGADQNRHHPEPDQIGRGHREPPVDPEDPVRREPEERLVEGPIEPLAEG